MGPTRKSRGDNIKCPPSAIGLGPGGGLDLALRLPFDVTRGRPCRRGRGVVLSGPSAPTREGGQPGTDGPASGPNLALRCGRKARNTAVSAHKGIYGETAQTPEWQNPAVLPDPSTGPAPHHSTSSGSARLSRPVAVRHWRPGFGANRTPIRPAATLGRARNRLPLSVSDPDPIRLPLPELLGSDSPPSCHPGLGPCPVCPYPQAASSVVVSAWTRYPVGRGRGCSSAQAPWSTVSHRAAHLSLLPVGGDRSDRVGLALR